MNDYAVLRQKNTAAWPAVIALLLCVALSASLLFGRLTAFARADLGRVIPLTRSSGLTAVTEGYVDESGAFRPASSAALNSAPLLAARTSPLLTSTIPGFSVSDEDKAWAGQTDIEIFRVSYENGEGKITVQSGSGDKIIAPGTSNTYKFTLENGYSMGVNYSLSMQAFLSAEGISVPIQVRLSDSDGNWLLGSADSMVDVMELNTVKDYPGSLSSGKFRSYTLEWEWPFEGGDDEFDTLLGNLAEDEDIVLTIVISTYAEADPEATGGDDHPYTGDKTDLTVLIVLLAVSGGALILLLLLPAVRKKREGKDE